VCRNIRVLHHFEPPTTQDEIRAAALQYVRKVAGITKMPKDGEKEIERAIEAVTAATTRLLEKLPEKGEPRTREGEKERAKKRWHTREIRIRAGASR
jgi:hypothetical protein